MFDLTIIGSGPTAISILMSMQQKKKISLAVINGVGKCKNSNKLNHVKIEYLNDEKKNFSDFFINKKKNLTIYSTNNIGGFANYWGGGIGFNQFKKIKIDRKLTISKKIYDASIKFFYNFFNLNLIDRKFFISVKNYFEPSKILKGFAKFKNKELKTFEYLYIFLRKKISFQEFNNKVFKIENNKKYVEIILADNTRIKSKKVILTAGVIGNSCILMNSFKTIKKCEFKDDCPWLIYGFSLNFKLNKFLKRKISSTYKSKDFFLSIYSLSSLSLNFFLYYMFKIKFYLFSNIKLKFFDFLIFGQLWNKNTKKTIILHKNKEFSIKEKSRKKLINEKKFLVKNRVFPLKLSETSAGKGFHYHNLKIIEKARVCISKFLFKKFQGKCICLDGSIYKDIEPGPHTATAMVVAYNIAKKIKF